MIFLEITEALKESQQLYIQPFPGPDALDIYTYVLRNILDGPIYSGQSM